MKVAPTKRGRVSRPDCGWPIGDAAEGLGARALVASVVERALAEWLDLVVAWNARVDLTAARSAGELVDLMVADALVLSLRAPHSARVVDVGAGAGAPGLALAVLRPDLRVTLVEPLAKRAAFLRTVMGTLDLSNVALEPRSGADVAMAHPRAWDVALARATLPPAAWLALAGDLVDVGGSAWVFLAREENPRSPSFVVAEEVSYTWPETAAARRLVRYERVDGPRPGG